MSQAQRTAVSPTVVSRLPLIDGTRGLACLMVVWAHTVDTSGWFYLYAVSPGKLGVVIFFFISGYLVIPGAIKKGNIRSFLITRALRLYPMYLVSLAVALVIWTLWADLLNPQEATPPLGPAQPSWLDWLLNITMGEQLLGSVPAMGVYWSLTVEFCLYVTIVVGLAVCPRLLARHLPVAMALGSVSIIAGFVRWYTHASIPTAVPLGLFCMFFGAMLRRSPNVPRTVIQLTPLYVFVVVPTCALAYSFDNGSDETIGRYMSSYLLGGLIFALVAIFVHADSGRLMKFVGDRSYGIYLFHMPIVMVVGLWVPVGHTRFIVVLSAVVAASAVLYRLVEIPSIRLGRNLVR